jgi:hypothetical protein
MWMLFEAVGKWGWFLKLEKMWMGTAVEDLPTEA